jgi:hypothetical protein
MVAIVRPMILVRFDNDATIESGSIFGFFREADQTR